jgi:virulence-associated protein VagC
MHGRSQALRLPLAFHLPGDRIRVRLVESGTLLSRS